MSVEIFTDGACRGNPGPGGWAALLRKGDTEKMISGAQETSTNNQMELMAAIQGLEQLKKTCARNPDYRLSVRTAGYYPVDCRMEA